ncbi:hypothetical protein EJ02DRAFT_515373 [Clathrospora elynae]|uniref:Uncharacterized protein n=1 Tax=Clathrospora elynae TaxID=706981 RepID=A0A6A5SBR4_9PLEO|nr:hypothetical protein EJ02DRAFT_515373 [Clathrospora elynae]
MKPQGSIFGTYGASLGIAEGPKTSEEGSDQNKNSYPQRQPPAIRPTGWKPSATIEAKINEAKKDPKTAERFLKAATGSNYSGSRAETRSETRSDTTSQPIALDTRHEGDHQLGSMACSFQAFSTINHNADPLYIN